MNQRQKLEIGIIVAIILAVLGLAYRQGVLTNRIDQLVSRQSELSEQISSPQISLVEHERITMKETVKAVQEIEEHANEHLKSLADKLQSALVELDTKAKAHKETILALKPTTVPEVTVLEPTWVEEGGILKVLSGQITIKASNVDVLGFRSTRFEVDIPGQSTRFLGGMQKGETETFQYGGHTFLLTLMDLRRLNEVGFFGEAQITIVKHLQ
jgi:outer membrane murein-binding lipoprotein Lpp